MKVLLQTYSHEQASGEVNIGGALAVKLASQELPDRPMQIELSPQQDGNLDLTFWGLPFRNHTIQTSPDLIEWTDLSTGIPGSRNEIDITLVDELEAPQKFYRLSHD